MTYDPDIDFFSDHAAARRRINSVDSAELREALYRASGLTPGIALAHWESDVVDKVIEAAAPVRPAKAFNEYVLAARAHCPLCGRSREGAGGHPAWAVPEGLARHLKGTHGTARCVVMEAARAILFCHGALLRLD